MKQFLSYLFCFLLLGSMLPAGAQTAGVPATVIVSPNHTDWKYKVNEEVEFNIQVLKSNNLLKNVTVDYEIGPEFFPSKQAQDVVLKDGKLTLKASMKQPGFLRCKVYAKVDGHKYDGIATVAVDEDKIQPTAIEPEDFDAFWNNNINGARNAPLDPEMELLPDRCTSTLNVYHASFQSNWGARIYGILTVPKKSGKYPAVLLVPGAGVYPFRGADYGPDIITFQIGIHGLPVNLPQEVYNSLNGGALSGYPWFNRNNRDAFYYKRVFIGCVRAVDFIYSLPEFDGETVGVTGGSQGGALTFVTAGLDSRIKFLAPNYPALCDHPGFLHGRAGGWPQYFRNGKADPDELKTLSYFDVVNFARRIKAPGWYSWGYNDEVCPPTSMHAAYNVVTAEKELHIYLETGHWTYPEQENERMNWIKEKCGNRKVLKDTDAVSSTLAGKQILLTGDSWCSGSGDGTGGWGAIIKSEFPTCDIVYKSDYGMDWWQGANFIFPATEKPENRWKLPEAPDYVLIEAYTNGLYQDVNQTGGAMTDGRASEAIKFGSVNRDKYPTDFKSLKVLHNNEDTWAYRAEWFLWQMQKKYAGNGKTKFAIVFPYRAPNMAGEKTAFHQFKPIVEELASKYGYPVLDMYEPSIIPYWNNELSAPYMWRKDNGQLDDCHLGLAGNKLITPPIIKFLLGL
jgi:cephalosporin-C deacetylase-like acetyl esterase